MTGAQIDVKSLDFRCEPWPIQGETMLDFHCTPILGTWTLTPEFLLRKGVKGILACPNCAHAALIRHDMGDVINGVCEIRSFSCDKCGFACHPRLLHWDKRKLFCIAYEKLDEITGLPMVNSDGDFVRKEYAHHETREDAFRMFVEGRRTAGRFRVIDVGPVIGFFGKESDKDQKDLTV